MAFVQSLGQLLELAYTLLFLGFNILSLQGLDECNDRRLKFHKMGQFSFAAHNSSKDKTSELMVKSASRHLVRVVFVKEGRRDDQRLLVVLAESDDFLETGYFVLPLVVDVGLLMGKRVRFVL